MKNPGQLHFATSAPQSEEQINHPINPDDSVGLDGHYDEGEVI